MEKNRTVFTSKFQGLLLYSKIKCVLGWAMMHNCIVAAGWFSVTNCIWANKVHSPEITQCGTNEWHWNEWRNQAVQWYTESLFSSLIAWNDAEFGCSLLFLLQYVELRARLCAICWWSLWMLHSLSFVFGPKGTIAQILSLTAVRLCYYFIIISMLILLFF